MDKFTPKTIEELNAEFEARIAKKQEEQRIAELEKQLEEEKKRVVEEMSYASALDNAVITATELEDDTAYSGEELPDETPAQEDTSIPEQQGNEYGEPDPHGYFGAPIDKSRPRKTLSEETVAKVEPKFDFERTSDYSGAMLQSGFKKEKKKHRGAKAVCAVLIAIILVVSALTAAVCVASANPEKFVLGRSLLVCEYGVPGSNISEGSLCLVKQADKAKVSDVVAYRTGNSFSFAFFSTLPEDAEIFAIATHCIPMLGRFILSVTEMWIVYACCAAAAILLILIIRIAAFGSTEQNVTDGVQSKKSRR